MKKSDIYLTILYSLINNDDFKLSYDVAEQYEILKELIEQISLAKFVEKEEEKKHE